MTGEQNLYSLSREMAAMIIDRVDSFDELHAATESEGDQKFAEATAKHINRVSLQPGTPEGKQPIRPLSQLDGECADYLLKQAGIDEARLEFPKSGKFPGGSLNVLEGGDETFMYDTASHTAFYRPDGAATSASQIVHKTVTALGLLQPTEALDTLVTYIGEFQPAEGTGVSLSIEDLMNRLNNPEQPVTLEDLQPEAVAEEVSAAPEPVAEELPTPPEAPATVEQPPTPKQEKNKGTERFGNPNQALDVLFRVAGRYSDLYQQAEAAQIEVQVERDLGNTRKATDIAWAAVREMNIKAAPRYLGSTRARIQEMDGKPYFAELMAQVKPMVDEATEIYDVRKEIAQLKKELDIAYTQPNADILALEETRKQLEKREKRFLRHGLPEVISLSRQAWAICERELRNPETRKRIQQTLIEEQRARRVQRVVPVGPSRNGKR